MKHYILRIVAVGLSLLTFTTARAAEGTVTFEVLTPEAALQAAQAALDNCRESGYQVAVAVVDRFGGIQVVLRDQLAAPRTVDTAVGKARTAAGFRTNTTEMVSVTAEGKPQAGIRNLPGVIIIGGGMLILVNNAGLISPTKHILEVDKAWWDRLIGVNLTGTFMCARRAAHIMARQGHGSIINMSSGGATKAHRAFVAYDASKGGIEAMTRALALDLGPYGVRVNCLVPGFIDTQDASEKVRQDQGAIVPLGRMGEAGDLAGSAVFLASSDSAYITGHRIVVDGGVLAQQRSANVDTYPPSKFPKLN